MCLQGGPQELVMSLADPVSCTSTNPTMVQALVYLTKVPPDNRALLPCFVASAVSSPALDRVKLSAVSLPRMACWPQLGGLSWPPQLLSCRVELPDGVATRAQMSCAANLDNSRFPKLPSSCLPASAATAVVSCCAAGRPAGGKPPPDRRAPVRSQEAHAMAGRRVTGAIPAARHHQRRAARFGPGPSSAILATGPASCCAQQSSPTLKHA